MDKLIDNHLTLLFKISNNYIMEKRYFIFIVLLVFFTRTYSQNECNYLKVNSVLNVMNEIQFKPINKIKGFEKEFKKLLLSIDERGSTWQQACINSWYICEKKSENYYRIWLMDYAKISREYWDRNCRELTFLLMSDTPALGQIN